MTQTSEERREVAARLRNLAGHRAADEELTLDALGLYRGENIEGYDTYGVMHLADLIDPTCEVEPMPDCVPHHRFSRWMCGKCGLVSFTPSNATGPSYCPYCGHRLVSGDD